MSEFLAYVCDDCGRFIHDTPSQALFYETVRVINLPNSPAPVPLSLVPLPQGTRSVLSNNQRPVQRCAECRAWFHQEDLLDESGTVVVAVKSHTTRDSFIGASSGLLPVAEPVVTPIEIAVK